VHEITTREGVGKLWRWVCICGAMSWRWYRSSEEAASASKEHLEAGSRPAETRHEHDAE
jgi:hypothetical protein